MITVPWLILVVAGGALGTVAGMITKHMLKNVKVLSLKNEQLEERVRTLEGGE